MSHPHTHDSGSCREIFAQLSAHLDGELTPEASRELEEHLCGCPPCIEFVNSLRRTVELCHGLDAGDAPAPLSSAARDQLLDACRRMLASRRG